MMSGRVFPGSSRRKIDGRILEAVTALRLSIYFGNSAPFRMNLQTHYELESVRREASADRIYNEIRPQGA
jgi:plasmid maintenance system antidote protein VapI